MTASMTSSKPRSATVSAPSLASLTATDSTSSKTTQTPPSSPSARSTKTKPPSSTTRWHTTSTSGATHPPTCSLSRPKYRSAAPSTPLAPPIGTPTAPEPSTIAAFQQGTLHVIHAPQYVQADKVDDFIAAVTLDGIGSTHEEPGCLRFDVYQNIEDPTELYLYEVYVNSAAFDYHVATPHIKQWRDTVADWYDEERRDASMAGNMGARRGRNVWPADNWNWSSGEPSF